MGLAFGLFDHLDQKPEAPAKTLADRLEVIRAAEAGGYRGYHLAEHHGTPLGMAASPSVFLASVATATTSIRLGPLVYLLPLYDPLRLVEEICLLDHLSDGRLEVGVGRGISPIELGFFGVDADETPAIAEEALAVIRMGLSGDRVTHRGRYFNYDDVPIALRPRQSSVPLWTASMSDDGIAQAAKTGMHTAALGNADMIKASIDGYRAHCASDDGILHGMYRIVVVAESDEKALAIAKPAYLEWFSKLIKLWREHGIEAPMLGPLDSFETATAIGMAVCGSPQTVAAALAEQAQYCGANYVLTQIAFGDLAHADEMRSLELFVERVIPELAA